jgi:hypothetical protein
MRTEATITIVVMAVVVILPLLPAFLLFRFLPSQGSAEGPFHGMTIKFSGAFSGYLVVFLALLAIRPGEANHYHTWTVSGSLVFDQPVGTPPPNPNDVFIRFVPPRLTVLNQGAFRWDIPVVEDRDGNLVFPDIQIDLRDYAGVTVPLDRSRRYGGVVVEAKYDEISRNITLSTPIVLKSLDSLPTYAGLDLLSEVDDTVAAAVAASGGGS